MKNIIGEIKSCIKSTLLLIAPHKVAHQIIYSEAHGGKKLNLKNPTTYDELIHYFIINRYDSSYGKYADKFLVRDFVRECGLENLLIPLIGGPFSTFDDINFKCLPNEFVIKSNHASGPNHYYICTNKKDIPIDELRIQFKNSLKQNFVRYACEYHYAKIKPCLIIEKLLHDRTARMTDYKVVCSYGNPLAILVCNDRNHGRDYYDIEWNHLNYTKEEFWSKEGNLKPKHLDEMLHAASILSSKFPIVRVDFYDIDDGLFFGEITLTPSAGYHFNLSENGQKELAEKIIQCCVEHGEFLGDIT